MIAVSLTSEPGATYTYSNLNYEVLGSIVQTVSVESFEGYLHQHVFAPLAMRHTFTDSGAAEHDGWSLAHQLQFGIPVTRAPFFRPDFVPAGWIISSAEDLAHYVIAQLNGGRYDGAAVLSAAGVEQLHRPAVRQSATLPDSYAMGWIVGPVLDPQDQLAPIWHDGSSYDMHAVVLLEPRERWGVVLLCNGTSFLYELLRKQDAIADGVAHRLAGMPVRGTFEGLYAAFDVVVALVTAMQLRALWGLLRRRPRGRSWWLRLADQLRLPWPRLPGWLATGWAWYAFGLAPLLVLQRGPALLGAPWPDLVHTDLGVWLLVVCGGQLLIGALRLRQGWQVAGHPQPRASLLLGS
jgi:beta-lactamase family protein